MSQDLHELGLCPLATRSPVRATVTPIVGVGEGARRRMSAHYDSRQ